MIASATSLAAGACVGAVGAWAPRCALAQGPAYPAPGRPIRLVVPAPPGGPGDIVARALAQQIAPLLDATVLVDNKPGGVSIPGAMDVARAASDGHTLLLTLNMTHTQVPHLVAKVPYDPFADFTPIAMVYRGHSILVAHPAFDAADLPAAIAASRARAVAFGSPGAGTTGHLYVEALNAEHGARFVHVPYKGSAPALQDLIGGTTQLLFDSPATSIPHVRAGRLKALAVTGTHRLEAMPALPTAAEQGIAGLDGGTWLGVFGPRALPPAVVTRLDDAIRTALGSSELRTRFGAMGVEIGSTTPVSFAAQVRSDHERWGSLIRRIGLRLD